MRFDEFNELVRSKLEEICGAEFSVSVYEAIKNNSVVHKGISIKENDNNVAPTIYMDEFYTDYCDGRDIQEIINDILKIYSENRLGPDIETEKFSDFEWVRDRIFFKLVNSRKNLALLQKIPSHPMLDLSLVFGVYMGSYKDSFSSVLIRNEHMEMWGTSEDEIRDLALNNTPRLLPSSIWTMGDILRDMGVSVDESGEEAPMYILSNKERINGASAMLYDGVLRKFAGNLGRDLYILPSSVHEIIIVPESEIFCPESLAEMIGEVNDTQVSGEEILSYSLYRYSRERDDIEIVVPGRSKKVASA
ncbi:MAG: DUF5688 family protein [Lachnospiraceae bacterium]|nr:DUF5688 family protein [Lachnospiraceae bacterium]